MAITNLTGTKWTFNETIDVSTPLDVKAINFTTAGASCTEIAVADNTLYYNPMGNGLTEVYYEDEWEVPQLREIEITGGADVENADLIAFLAANGTVLMPVTFTETNTALHVYDKLTPAQYEELEKEPHAFYIVKNVGVYKGSTLIASKADSKGFQVSTEEILFYTKDFGQDGLGTLYDLMGTTDTLSDEIYHKLYETATFYIENNTYCQRVLRIDATYQTPIYSLDPNTHQIITTGWNTEQATLGTFSFKERRGENMLWVCYPISGWPGVQITINTTDKTWTVQSATDSTYVVFHDLVEWTAEEVMSICEGSYNYIQYSKTFLPIIATGLNWVLIQQFADYSANGTLDGVSMLRPIYTYYLIEVQSDNTVQCNYYYSFPSTVFANETTPDSDETLSALFVDGTTYAVGPKAGDYISVDSDHTVNLNLPSVLKTFTYGNLGTMQNAKFSVADFEKLKYQAAVLGFTATQGTTNAVAYMFRPVYTALSQTSSQTSQVETIKLVCENNPKMSITLICDYNTNTVTSTWTQEDVKTAPTSYRFPLTANDVFLSLTGTAGRTVEASATDVSLNINSGVKDYLGYPSLLVRNYSALNTNTTPAAVAPTFMIAEVGAGIDTGKQLEIFYCPSWKTENTSVFAATTSSNLFANLNSVRWYSLGTITIGKGQWRGKQSIGGLGFLTNLTDVYDLSSTTAGSISINNMATANMPINDNRVLLSCNTPEFEHYRGVLAIDDVSCTSLSASNLYRLTTTGGGNFSYTVASSDQPLNNPVCFKLMHAFNPEAGLTGSNGQYYNYKYESTGALRMHNDWFKVTGNVDEDTVDIQNAKIVSISNITLRLE